MSGQTTARSLRRRINYPIIYRIFMCCIACTVIFAAVALKLSHHFDPSALEGSVLGDFGGFTLPVTLREDEEMKPGREGILKNGIFVTEEVKEADRGDDSVYPITEIDMSSGAAKGEVLIRDSDSGQSVDVKTLLASTYPEALRDDGISRIGTKAEPLVLILHTHATESFAEEGAVSYTEKTEFRNEDTSKNMVAVGKVMARILNERGVPTVHCETLHDAEDYNASYDNSLATVQKYLKEYPTIKYVFDLHRDAMIRENGEALKPLCNINGKPTAQVMTLVGTDAGGADHSLWQENNMNLAVKLQYRLTSEYNGMARPINLRKLSFHQQYAPGSLLFEIGSCANTLEEAKNAVANLAEAIADTINNS